MHAGKRKLVLLVMLVVIVLAWVSPILASPPFSACNGLKYAHQNAYAPHLADRDLPEQVVDIMTFCLR